MAVANFMELKKCSGYFSLCDPFQIDPLLHQNGVQQFEGIAVPFKASVYFQIGRDGFTFGTVLFQHFPQHSMQIRDHMGGGQVPPES